MASALSEGSVLAAMARFCNKAIYTDRWAAELIETWGLHYHTAAQVALTFYILEDHGLQIPTILSGRRTCEEQRQLRDERRPAARQSFHTQGRAIDLEEPDPNFAYVWKLLGGRDGADFKTPDPNHYDDPGPETPPRCW